MSERQHKQKGESKFLLGKHLSLPFVWCTRWWQERIRVCSMGQELAVKCWAPQAIAQPPLVMVKNVYGAKLICCMDCEQHHRKKTVKMLSFVSVSKLYMSALNKIFGPGLPSGVTVTDQLCRDCYRYCQSCLSSQLVVEGDCDCVPQEQVVTQISERISSVDIDVTLVRNPSQ